jgi:menaquinone-specific isochorismate synthase
MARVVSDGLARDAGRLTVRTIEVPDTGDVLAGLPGPDVVAWVRHGSGLAGWGEAARVTLPSGEDRFTAGEKWLRSVFDNAVITDEVRLRGTGAVAFGTFTFDASSDGSALIVPRVLRGRDGRGRAWLTTVSCADSGQDYPEPVRPELALPERVPAGIRWHDGSLSAPRWEQAVARAVAAIKASGSLRKVVLARDLYATAAEPIDARVLLRRLAERYPDCYTFACDGMIGATPELLIQRDGDAVSALVLAGTTPRGASAAEDEALGAALLADRKNTEEHAYAVTSLRETLGPLCGTLSIEPRPVLIKLPNLQHLGTHVRGTLRHPAPGSAGGTARPALQPALQPVHQPALQPVHQSALQSALALAGAVHPTAAVCGTPTGEATELIRELEQMDRERYAGPVGWMDAEGNGEWGIALRCAQLNGRTARLFAGGGIVVGSEPPSELAEAQMKFRPMRNALEG